jgi:hypothetical protein
VLDRNHHRVAVAAFLLVAMTGITAGADAPKDAPKEKAYSDPREMLVSPRSAPIPELRYRLLPLESRRTPGDAAPIYLRLGLQANADAKALIKQKATDWGNLPLDQFPVAEARKLVDRFAQPLQQLDYGARRQTCNWNYTLPEQKERAIEVLLPDAQDMRNWVRLQAIKARVEIAEGNVPI